MQYRSAAAVHCSWPVISSDAASSHAVAAFTIDRPFLLDLGTAWSCVQRISGPQDAKPRRSCLDEREGGKSAAENLPRPAGSAESERAGYERTVLRGHSPSRREHGADVSVSTFL